jgi:hypothetical protein
MCRYNHFCANVVKGLGAFWDNVYNYVIIHPLPTMYTNFCTMQHSYYNLNTRSYVRLLINKFYLFLIKNRSEKYFYFAVLMNYKFYSLLCGNNALKQKTVHLFMIFYVHVLLYNAAKYFCV